MKTALHYAAKKKNPLMVKTLIRLGADINTVDEVRRSYRMIIL